MVELISSITEKNLYVYGKRRKGEAILDSVPPMSSVDKNRSLMLDA